jgi:asparagine synthase (glutamine-hydrolysing)
MALRLDSQIMLVDDPVKRVDNMTMAWGLEARVPFLDHEVLEIAARIPPELKLAQEGKGVLKEAARRVIPSEVIDRPKGYFPVPALKYLQGPYLDLVRDALHAPEARERGLFEPPTSTGCSPTPTRSSPRCAATSCGSSAARAVAAGPRRAP